jgi:hypothetical protein
MEALRMVRNCARWDYWKNENLVHTVKAKEKICTNNMLLDFNSGNAYYALIRKLWCSKKIRRRTKTLYTIILTEKNWTLR